MKIDAHGKTDVGRARGHNEDYLLIDPEMGLHVVCDGMGGHAAGEVASKTAAEAVRDAVRAEADAVAAASENETPESIEAMTNLVRRAIERASDQVWEMGKEPGKHGMGCTCVCLLSVGSKAYLGTVGDSRVYLVRDGALHQLSHDHNYAAEAIRNGMMTPEDAWASPYANMVTRGVGVQATVSVETLAIDVVPGDTYLLCTDGLYQYFEDRRELAELLSGDVDDALTVKLVDLANERGGDDNISALVVRAANDDVGTAKRQTQINQNLQALRYIALFMDMSMPELCRVFNAFRPVEFAAGDTVIREAETSDGLFVVVEGDMSVTRKGNEIAKLGAGSHFGEMALLNQRPRSATVSAVEPSRLLVLDRGAFNELLQSDATTACKFLYKLAQTLSMRLDDANMVQDAEAARRTMELGVLSPFSRHG